MASLPEIMAALNPDVADLRQIEQREAIENFSPDFRGEVKRYRAGRDMFEMKHNSRMEDLTGYATAQGRPGILLTEDALQRDTGSRANMAAGLLAGVGLTAMYGAAASAAIWAYNKIKND